MVIPKMRSTINCQGLSHTIPPFTVQMCSVHNIGFGYINERVYVCICYIAIIYSCHRKKDEHIGHNIFYRFVVVRTIVILVIRLEVISLKYIFVLESKIWHSKGYYLSFILCCAQLTKLFSKTYCLIDCFDVDVHQ